MSTPLAPCFKTRLRLAGQTQWTPGPDVIVNPRQGPYTAAKDALTDACENNPSQWLNTRVEVQAVDVDLIGTQNPTDLDWDTYTLIARQTLTISDA